MKRSTVWLLVGVMIFAFAGLLYMQVFYIQIIMKSQKDQFKEAVKRSLLQVSHSVELDATEKILNEQLDSFARKWNRPWKQRRIIIEEQHSVSVGKSEKLSSRLEINILESVEKPLSSFGKSDLNSRSQAIVDALHDRYFYEQNLLYEVIQKKMQTANLSIEERLDFKKLETYIQTELTNNDLALPFEYAVIDNKQNVLFKSLDFDTNKSKDIFTQVLFPKNAAGKLYFLQVVFPTQKKYLLNSLGFIVPSVAFTFVLLLVFIITMYIVLRQKHLSEMKKDFIGNMTHELKTPVTSIYIAAQMLNDENVIKTMTNGESFNLSGSFNKITRTIIDETKRLQFLIDKVLQMSLVEDGRSILKIKEVDANDLLLNVAQLFDLQVEKCGGKLDLELNAMESTIRVDEMHFTNVIFNLMENAVKYRRLNVPLLLVAKTENVNEENIQISISDNGTGIKKENLKKIFDRFYRVSTGNVHNVKGFGLGLAYVKRIIDELNGTIKVESELNAGTTFIITLPYVE